MNSDNSKLVSEALLQSLLFDWLGITADENDRETITAVLDLATSVAEEEFLSHCRIADIEEPELRADGVHIHPAVRAALARFRELGFFGLSFPEALGGLGFGTAASSAVYSIFASANISTAGYPMLTGANARLLCAFGSEAQRDTFAIPQIEGRWFGTMCLSEPQAGSSLGDIRTRAVAEGSDALGDRYRVVGNKMWISGGDQNASDNIVHLVLAKVAQPDGTLPAGSRGISLFIVPKFLPDGTRNDVSVAGLNHKLGYRGASNCLLNFGEGEGAIGWRVGGEGQGLAQMFMMMNEARISVGVGAAALAYRGYRQSLQYARERLQGRPSTVRPDEPPVAIIAHPDVRRMLMQQRVYAEGALALCLYCANLVDQHEPESEALLALLTPIAKSWASEFGLMANDLAIQIHGGYGYTRDFDVEQLWRDNRLNPIHEGTTGIQAMDLLRRKLGKSDGSAFALLIGRIGVLTQAARQSAGLAPLAEQLDAYWQRVGGLVERLMSGTAQSAEDEATLFLRAFGHGVVAWLWLDQAIKMPGSAEHGRDTAEACGFFFRTELPVGHSWLAIVENAASHGANIPESAFG